jgi:hypothetical protein
VSLLTRADRHSSYRPARLSTTTRPMAAYDAKALCLRDAFADLTWEVHVASTQTRRRE